MSQPLIHDDGKTNPLIEVPREMLLAWLRDVADKAGYADRETSMVQVELAIDPANEVGFFEGGREALLVPMSSDRSVAFWWDVPTLTLMVSNIPNSRDNPHASS